MARYEQYDYEHEQALAGNGISGKFALLGGVAAIALSTAALFHFNSRPLPSAQENLQSGKISLVNAGRGNNTEKDAIIDLITNRFYNVDHASGIFWAIGANAMHEVRIYDAPSRGTDRSNAVVITSVDPAVSAYTKQLFESARQHNKPLVWIAETGTVDMDRDVGSYTYTVTGTGISRTVDVSRDAGSSYAVAGNGFALITAPSVEARSVTFPEHVPSQP